MRSALRDAHLLYANRHLQLPLFQNLRDVDQIVRETSVYVELPSQVLALFDRAILEDTDYVSLPRFQLVPSFCGSYLVRVEDKIEIYNSKVLQ